MKYIDGHVYVHFEALPVNTEVTYLLLLLLSYMMSIRPKKSTELITHLLLFPLAWQCDDKHDKRRDDGIIKNPRDNDHR